LRWVAVFLLAGPYETTTRPGITELALFAVSIALGAGAVLAAETSTGLAPVLLTAFIAAIVATWTVQLLHQRQLIHRRTPHRRVATH
jgi:hypothetical protein